MFLNALEDVRIPSCMILPLENSRKCQEQVKTFESKSVCSLDIFGRNEEEEEESLR